MTNYNPKSIPAQDRMPGRALLNRTECSALRGIAILGIFLHNYLHWLKPMIKENEYQFHQANVDGMMERIMSPSWDILLQFFSFFGHYGVPVFLFLSGYGLVLKYENAGQTASGGDTVRDVWQFIRQHFMKLSLVMERHNRPADHDHQPVSEARQRHLAGAILVLRPDDAAVPALPCGAVQKGEQGSSDADNAVLGGAGDVL